MKILVTIALFCSLGCATAQDLSGLFEQVSPAVVMIFTEENDLVESEGNTMKTTSRGLGSGFLISDKEIITAAHVVDVPESVKVEFTDGDIIPAKVVRSQKRADVAMIELLWPKKNAVTVSLADSDALKAGNRVFIIGAPFGLGQSLSVGYVSGFKRQLDGNNPFGKSEFIQTDAAINTGNSGGPMFNMQGKVIGVVSHITTKTGGFQGIGYAASSNIAKKILIEDKTPWSGADLFPLTGELAKEFNLPQKSGLLVQRVVFSSPLGIKGVRGGNQVVTVDNQNLIVGGDIILAFNDIQFDITDEALTKLSNFVSETNLEGDFKLTVLRNGEVIVLGR